MRLLFALILLLLPAAARAQDQSALCELLPAHKPSADVEYKPGVDVYGRPVAPADLGAPAPAMVPDVVRVPLTVDLAERFGGDLPAGTQLEAQMGMIEIHRDGRVTYNGRDLTAAAQAICGSGGAIEPQPQPAEPQPLPPAAEGDIIHGEGH